MTTTEPPPGQPDPATVAYWQRKLDAFCAELEGHGLICERPGPLSVVIRIPPTGEAQR